MREDGPPPPDRVGDDGVDDEGLGPGVEEEGQAVEGPGLVLLPVAGQGKVEVPDELVAEAAVLRLAVRKGVAGQVPVG